MGRLLNNLKQSPSDLRRSRATLINDGAQLKYKQLIELMEYAVKSDEDALNRNLDIAPNSSTSLPTIDGFDAEDFVKRDAEAVLNLAKKKENLKILKERYSFIFEDEAEETSLKY